MNLALLLPAGLVALSALVLPLLLHLARRSERRPLDFAALRWLTPHARPRRHVRFDEIPLLVVRLLLVATLALLLAQPVLDGMDDATPWVVAAPAVPAEVLAASGSEQARRAWLAPGFPDAASPPGAAAVPLGSLLRELDALLPAGAPLTVLVPQVFDGADAERPRLSREVDWRVVPAGVPAEVATVAPRARAMPTLFVRHDPDAAGALRYLRATAQAWAAESPPGDRPAIEVATVEVPPPADAELLAWLRAGPLPASLRAWVDAGGTLLLDARAPWPGGGDTGTVVLRDAGGTALLRGLRLERGRVLQWMQPMTPASMPALLEPDFPSRLRDVLAPAPQPARADADAYAPTTGADAWPRAPRDLAPWLALFAAGLFLLERWMAASPRRLAAR